ncbi:hypothetical protein T492DRAFT_889742, partial [Pavlovales sp. CCMP2436]
MDALGWLPWSRRLAAVLIEDAFGEMVADVAAVLAESGPITFDALLVTVNAALARGHEAISAHSARGVRVAALEARLTRRQVGDCLLILIQHGLVTFELRQRETSVGPMSSSKSSK